MLNEFVNYFEVQKYKLIFNIQSKTAVFKVKIKKPPKNLKVFI